MTEYPLTRCSKMLLLAAMGLAAPELHAQRAPECDSTLVVQQKLASRMDVRAVLTAWINPNSNMSLLFDGPELVNRAAIARKLVHSYPPSLRDRGMGGTVVTAILVDTTGRAKDVHVVESSGYVELDKGAKEVAEAAEFKPARLDSGCAVPVLVLMPFVFRSQR